MKIKSIGIEPLGSNIKLVYFGYLVGSFVDNKIKISDNNLKFTEKNLIGHSDKIKALAETDFNTLASGSCDGTIKIWDTFSYKNISTLYHNSGCINDMLCVKIANENYLISGSDDSTIKLWQKTTKSDYELIENIKHHNDSVKAIVYYKNYYVATGSLDSNVKVWQLNNYNYLKIATLTGHHSKIKGSVMDEKKEIMVSYSLDEIFVWNLTSYELINFKSISIYSLIILPNGNIAACSNEEIKILDPLSLDLKANLIGHENNVSSLAILPNGNIVSGSWDSTIKVWNSVSYELLATLKSHSDKVNVLAVLPNGNIVLDRVILQSKYGIRLHFN